ncbi:polyisoprenoid-binding protein YceI [Pedobacter cryoconitis]|uniref:Polyisoprenoid-binding protein YceI n=1 Tax=Pedobacter cryoconitis TaxID=188932 RepID=A0A7W8ZMD8_9SPHI|nr:YceI family protein [Pedobacter cryoconitis]MBB5636691.1 polyisoprenoid-binding protein YceI [Pedobacter cryoconitis]MBB6274685.1 polyisoprenoid-binding protein YceI [Pedobacter cryoconitis]
MATTKWVLDPTHSELQFKVKHLMISTVTGSFNEFSAELATDNDDFENSTVSFKAGVDSIDTGNKDRDGHLKSGDFFNAAEFPSVSFVSTSFTKDGDDYKLAGNLTIKDVTKPVTLDVEFGGTAQDPWGNTKAGFTIKGKINRTDFGLTYNAALETGGVMLGEEVRVLGELQFAKQA